MNIVIRVDSSTQIGSGHLMRCLTLADFLAEAGCTVSFLCRNLPGNMSALAQAKGYMVYLLAEDSLLAPEPNGWHQDAEGTARVIQQTNVIPDWLIVDQYGLDVKWETKLRKHVKKIMVIDDLADRQHDCDVLLDQNYYSNSIARYNGLVPDRCQLFLGPRYALLRSEFYTERDKIQSRDGFIQNILVFFGGSDPTHETIKTLQALRRFDSQRLRIVVVVGASNPAKEEVRLCCEQMPNTEFFCQVETMAKLMAWAHLAIGAGGSTTWERCYLGLPSLTIVVAPNQQEVTEAVSEFGATWNLGLAQNVSEEDIYRAITNLLQNPDKVKRMTDTASRLMGSVDNEIKNLFDTLMGV